MTEISASSAPSTIAPALGQGGRLPSRTLRLRIAVLAVVGLLLAAAVVVDKVREPRAVDPPIRGAKVLTAQIIRGGQPSDGDLLMLRNVHDVSAVVNLRQSDGGQARVADEFGLDYLWLPIPSGRAPDATALTALVDYMRQHRGDVVYIHDDVGGGRAIAAAAMLLALRRPVSRAEPSLTPAERRELTPEQRGALAELQRAVTPRPPSDNRYRKVVKLQW